ncbi:hypothetical protein NDU88_000744, partial [Pleurodeles waltl]
LTCLAPLLSTHLPGPSSQYSPAWPLFLGVPYLSLFWGLTCLRLTCPGSERTCTVTRSPEITCLAPLLSTHLPGPSSQYSPAWPLFLGVPYLSLFWGLTCLRLTCPGSERTCTVTRSPEITC